jgi:hypothetical protein
MIYNEDAPRNRFSGVVHDEDGPGSWQSCHNPQCEWNLKSNFFMEYSEIPFIPCPGRKRYNQVCCFLVMGKISMPVALVVSHPRASNERMSKGRSAKPEAINKTSK